MRKPDSSLGREGETWRRFLEDARREKIRAIAERAFRRVEKILLDLGMRLVQAQGWLEEFGREYRQDYRGSRLALSIKKRKAHPHLLALPYWAVFCKAPREHAGYTPLPGGTKKPRWMKHIAGGLTHSHIFLSGIGIHRKEALLEVDRRRVALKGAAQAVVRGVQRVLAILVAWRDRRSWESGDIELPAPQVLLDLAARARTALGAAWPMLLRMATVEVELELLATRYASDPAYAPFRLVFSKRRGDSFARMSWRSLGRALLPRRGKGPQKKLTDRRMREAGIPAAARRLLLVHEGERRRIVGLYRKYTDSLRGLEEIGRGAIRKAARLVAKAIRREASAGRRGGPGLTSLQGS